MNAVPPKVLLMELFGDQASITYGQFRRLEETILGKRFNSAPIGRQTESIRRRALPSHPKIKAPRGESA